MVGKNVSKKQTRKTRKKGGDDNNKVDVSEYIKNGGYVYFTYKLVKGHELVDKKLIEIFNDNNILKDDNKFEIRYEINEDKFNEKDEQGNLLNANPQSYMIHLKYPELMDNQSNVIDPQEKLNATNAEKNKVSHYIAKVIPTKDSLLAERLNERLHEEKENRLAVSRYEPFPQEERERRDNRKKEEEEKERIAKEEEEEKARKVKEEEEKARKAKEEAPEKEAAVEERSFLSRLNPFKKGGKRKHKSKRKSLKNKRKQTKKRKGRR